MSDQPEDNVVRLSTDARPREVLNHDIPETGGADPREGRPYRTFCCVAAEGDDGAMQAWEDPGVQQWRFWEAYDDQGTVDAIAELLIAPDTPLEVALDALDTIRLALIAEYHTPPEPAA